jgi:ADP-ribose pyrophosphatase
MKEKTLRSEILYKGRIIGLTKDIVEVNGRKSAREIITHPGSSVTIPVLDINQKKLLLIKQYRYAVKSFMIELPAGTRKKGEGALECAKRELSEETGFIAGKIKQIACFMPSPGMMTEKMSLFIASRLVRSRQKPDFDEQITVMPATLDNAVKMVFDGSIRDGKTIAGILMLKEIYGDKKLFKKYL